MPYRQQFVLCRPQGGLNDILCQIERVCRYAERFDRAVFVDTDSPGTLYFKDEFSKYFLSKQDRLVLNPDDIRSHVDEMETFPGFLAGRVSCYGARYDREVKNWVDLDTGNALSFDFNNAYRERLLVHHAAGGGTISIRALARMQLQPSIAGALWKRIRKIGSPYAAVHVRNTDYRTDYEPMIGRIANALRGPVFVATDDPNTIARFKSVLGEERVYSFATLPPERIGKPLHHIDAQENGYIRNCDAILDLLKLALASELYLLPVLPNEFGAKYSGFSKLAANLKTSPAVLRELTGPRTANGGPAPALPKG